MCANPKKISTFIESRIQHVCKFRRTWAVSGHPTYVQTREHKQFRGVKHVQIQSTQAKETSNMCAYPKNISSSVASNMCENPKNMSSFGASNMCANHTGMTTNTWCPPSSLSLPAPSSSTFSACSLMTNLKPVKECLASYCPDLLDLLWGLLSSLTPNPKLSQEFLSQAATSHRTTLSSDFSPPRWAAWKSDGLLRSLHSRFPACSSDSWLETRWTTPGQCHGRWRSLVTSPPLP